MVEFRVPIKGYPNYSIDTLGKIRNQKRNKERKLQVDKDGYYVIKLYNNGKSKDFRVSRLVLEHFKEKVPDKNECDHIDRDRKNNNITNLRWANRSENNKNRGKWYKNEQK